ncbi:MAG: flagellar basal body P-ring formation chaperone FlgA [Mariprofundales bacterium]|nr:flagellar basal body P-ring formation chaperone FlgA [Mariprofundales bacterium]
MRLLQYLSLLGWVVVALMIPVQAEAEVEDSALVRSLHDFFAAGVQFDGARAELVSVGSWPKYGGAMRWSLPRLHRHPRYFSLIAEPVNGSARRGKRLRRWFVRVEVRWLAKVVVAKSDISARTMLNHSMVTMGVVDIAGHNSNPLSSSRVVDGLRLLRQVKRGEAIFVAMTHQLPMIKRGQLVTIEVRRGVVQVSTAGRALRAARRGELVLVENLRSKRQVQGVVINAHTVRVQVGGGAV